MAGKLNNAAIAAGTTILAVLKLLVLALWIGGGLVVAALATFFLERVFTEKQLPDKSGEIADRILSSFSTTEVIAGGILCVLLFIFERKRRGGVLALIGFVLLVVLTAVNQFIISGLQGYGIHSTVYQAIFFAQIGIALIFLSVLALAGKAPPPAVQPAAPAGVAILPVIPPAALPAPPPPVPAQAVRPPPEPSVVARPGAGSPPYAQPSTEAAPPSAPGKPTALPVAPAEIDELLTDGDPQDHGRGEKLS